MNLTENQITVLNRLRPVLKKYKLAYLAGQIRSRKTAIALSLASEFESTLLITKKKAIDSILSDYESLELTNDFDIINYESIHKITKSYQLIICDESHSVGSYPKPSKRFKGIKSMMNNNTYLLLMSGTPTPESWSQIYHQLNISQFSPFSEYTNFYKWAKKYVDVKDMRIGSRSIKVYKDANQYEIEKKVKHLFVKNTRKDAGFETEVKEHILEVEMKPITNKLISRLKKDRVIEGKEEVILADTPVKLMQKIHQLSSGTIKFESGKRKVIDNTKALFVKSKFKGQKIAIFYKFIAELQMIKEVFKDEITTDIATFQKTDKSIALQVVSGREGVNLSKADSLIFINIDFSATSYFQAIQRMAVKDRKKNNAFWIFSKNGIESKIYNTVKNKKNYTLYYFQKNELANKNN